MRLTAAVIRRKFATLAILAGLLVLGAVSLFSMPVDFLPDITYPMIRVSILWPGATPEEIDRSIADPLERQMASVDGVDYLESSITEGNYRLMLNFSYDSDVNVAFMDASAALGRVNRRLPEDIDPPLVAKMDPSQLPILLISISSQAWDLTRLRTWAEDQLQKQLLSVPGVAGTEIVGGLRREIRVFLQPEALIKYKLTTTEIQKRIADENVEMFAGRIIEGRRHWVVRTMGEVKTVAELRNIILLNRDGAKVTLGDVAEVLDASEDVRLFTRLNSSAAIKVSVTKQALANTVTVARAVTRKLEELKPDLPADVKLLVLENQAVYIADAIDGVTSAALGAAILVIITIFLFLGSLRHVLVLLLAIPVILLVNFGVMKLAGFSLNIFSLGGLVVALGVLLDNSIVVLENITRRRGLAPHEPSHQLIPDAVSEVGPAIAAGTLSYLALFLPFLFVPGLTSLLFKELILVISGIVVISVGVAITLTPMLAEVLLKSQEDESGLFQRIFARITSAYARSAAWFLRWRWVWLFVAIGLLLAGAWTWQTLEGEFLPMLDDGRVSVRVRAQPGTSAYELNAIAGVIEKLLAQEPRVDTFFTVAGGRGSGGFMVESSNDAEISVQLKSGGGRMRTMQWVNQFRRKLQKFNWPGVRVMVTQQRIRGIRRLGDSDMEIKIRGDNLEDLRAVSAQMVERISRHPSFTNVQLSLDFSKPEYQVHLDREKCADLGLSVRDIADSLRTYLGGSVVTSFRERGLQFDVRLSIPESRIHNAEDLRMFPVARADGAQILLSDVAQVLPGNGPVEISREDQAKQVSITATTVGLTVSAAQVVAGNLLDDVSLRPGVTWKFSGQAQMMQEMQLDMLMILLFALFFAFIVLAVQFNDWKLPTLILVNLPACLAGVLFSLKITGFPVGATVLIGMLVVVAAAINDGVLLFTFADDLRREGGTTPDAAILQAAAVRLRPRVMTTLSTLVGFLPLALNLGGGNEMLQPMAAGAIGGLIMETFVALYLMPVLYRFAYRTALPIPDTTAADGGQ
jgi:hydrophobe/amphiphile efflux-1 (HAE1) family protein